MDIARVNNAHCQVISEKKLVWKSRSETSKCQVVKIFAFVYKGRGFESPNVHFHTGDPATCNTQTIPTHPNQRRFSSSISLTQELHAQQPQCLGRAMTKYPPETYNTVQWLRSFHLDTKVAGSNPYMCTSILAYIFYFT